MITIFEGSIKEVKEEMKKEKKEASKLRSKIIKRIGSRDYAHGHMTVGDRQNLLECEQVQALFLTSKYIPVRLTHYDMLVNYTLLQEFSRKLKGYAIKTHVEQPGLVKTLVVEYTKGKSRGRLELHELPAVFGSLSKIPSAYLDIIEDIRGYMANRNKK